MGADWPKKIARARDLIAVSRVLYCLDLVLTGLILVTGVVSAAAISYWLGQRTLPPHWPLVSLGAFLLAVVAKLRLQKALGEVSSIRAWLRSAEREKK